MKRWSIITIIVLFVVTIVTPAFAQNAVVIASRLWSRPVEQEFVIKEVLKPFEEQNNCKVSFQYFGSKELLERAAIQHEIGNITTDVVIVYAADMQRWVDAGYVMNLNQYAGSWTDRSFSKGLANMTIFDGNLYFVPIGADVYLLIANKKALKYLPEGVDVQDLSWEQVVDWAVVMAQGEGEGKYALTGVPGKMLIYQYGGVILSYGGGFPTINSPGAVNAWKLLVKMKDVYTPNVLNYVSVVEPMKREEAWLSVTHCARVGDIYKSNPAQFVVAPAPKGPAGIGSIAGTSGLGIMKGAPNQKLAVRLVEYLSSPEIQLKIAKGTGGFIPPVDEAIELLGDSTEDEVIKKALHVMDNGVLAFIPPIFGPNWGAVKAVYDNAFRKLVLQDGAVDKVYLDKAQEEIDKLKVQ